MSPLDAGVASPGSEGPNRYFDDDMTTLKEYADSRELVVNLTLRELRSRYKKSVLGWTWSLLNPLASVAIYTIVFSVFLKVQPPRSATPAGSTAS